MVTCKTVFYLVNPQHSGIKLMRPLVYLVWKWYDHKYIRLKHEQPAHVYPFIGYAQGNTYRALTVTTKL